MGLTSKYKWDDGELSKLAIVDFIKEIMIATVGTLQNWTAKSKGIGFNKI